MLPGLGALSLAPTGAKDDVVAEIFKEREGPLRRRYEAEQEPPIYTLDPGPFSLIVDELAKRLAPDAATVSAQSAETLCKRVYQACRELATLNLLPGQSIDLRYDCYADPNGDVWKAAHVIFGVDPARLGPVDKGPLTWRANLSYLCQAFDPGFMMEVDVPGTPGEWGESERVGTRSLWFELWETVPENRQVAADWQELQAREVWEDDFNGVDSDDEDFQEFEQWYIENEYDDNPPTRYDPSHDQILALQTRLRDRDAPGRSELANRMLSGIENLRYQLTSRPSTTREETGDGWLARNGSGEAHEFRIKLDALFRLLGAIRSQVVSQRVRQR